MEPRWSAQRLQRPIDQSGPGTADLSGSSLLSSEMCAYAASRGVAIAIEPINRFEVDDFQLADGAGIEPEVEIAQRHPGRNRKFLPIEVEFEHWCFAAGRPVAATMRLLTQSAFVDKDDRAALFLGFFLMAGQLLRFQLRMASSLRSRALPTGRCGLQLSVRRIFQTWPS